MYCFPLDCRVVDEDVTHHQHPIVLLGELDELGRVGGVGGDRLLDEHVLALLERLLDELVVGDRRRGHHHRVHVVRLQDLRRVLGRAHAGVTRAHVLEPARCGVGDPGHLAVQAVVEVAQEVGAPVARADDGDSSHSVLSVGEGRVRRTPWRSRRPRRITDAAAAGLC